MKALLLSITILLLSTHAHAAIESNVWLDQDTRLSIGVVVKQGQPNGLRVTDDYVYSTVTPVVSIIATVGDTNYVLKNMYGVWVPIGRDKVALIADAILAGNASISWTRSPGLCKNKFTGEWNYRMPGCREYINLSSYGGTHSFK